MSAFDALIERARKAPARVALPESTDPRVLEAAVTAMADGRARPVLVGDTNAIHKAANERFDLSGIEIIDVNTEVSGNPAVEKNTLANALYERRKHKGLSESDALAALDDPLTLACTLVHTGAVDGCVAGAEYATADVTRSALQIVGTGKGASFVSSFFLMVMDKDFHPVRDIVVFADCALVVDPDAEQLAEIAQQTGGSTEALLGKTPRIALLSFSTDASAKHPHVEKVREAPELAKNKAKAAGSTTGSAWTIIGDVQLDAAVIPEILQKKAPAFAADMQLDDKGHQQLPNVLVFPSLDAGNIGYKLCERFGGCDAIGPVLQGLARPVNDLSRGCKASDIEKILAVTSLQAAGNVAS